MFTARLFDGGLLFRMIKRKKMMEQRRVLYINRIDSSAQRLISNGIRLSRHSPYRRRRFLGGCYHPTRHALGCRGCHARSNHLPLEFSSRCSFWMTSRCRRGSCIPVLLPLAAAVAVAAVSLIIMPEPTGSFRPRLVPVAGAPRPFAARARRRRRSH
jgi:hypothetical protein